VSSGYKKFIADKGLPDETYTADSIALIRISGTSPHNNKVVQVDAVCPHKKYSLLFHCSYVGRSSLLY